MQTLVQRTWQALREAPSTAEGQTAMEFMRPSTVLALIAVAQVSDIKHHGIAGSVTSRDVAAYTGMARTTAALHLNKLVGYGWLARRGTGEYVYSLYMPRLTRLVQL